MMLRTSTMGETILAASVLCLLARTPSAQERASYRLGFDPGPPIAVRVEARMPAARALRTGSYGAWSTPRGWSAFVHELQASDENGRALALRPGEGRAWELEAASTASILLSYRVDLAHAEQAEWLEGPRTTSAFRSGDALFVLLSALVVHADESLACELEIDVPPGWTVLAPWPEPSPARFRVPAISNALRNVLVVGRVAAQREQVADFTAEIVLLDQPEDVAPAVGEVLRTCVASYAELFDARPEGRFLAVLYQDRWDTAEAYDDGFVLATTRPLDYDSRSIWAQTIAHELFHRWNGRAFEAAVWEDSNWFLEGVTDYVASLALVRAGILEVEEFLGQLEKHVAFFRLHRKGRPFSGVDLVTAGRDKSVNNPALYDGGWLMALAMDVLVQEANRSERGIEDLLRALLELCRTTGAKYTNEDLLALGDELSDGTVGAFLRAHVLASEPVDLVALAHRAGFTLALGAEQAHAAVDPAPSPQARRIRNRILHGRFGAREQALSLQVDELFAAFDHSGSPGAAVAISQDGVVLHSRGYGLANLEARTPIGPATRFHAASVSKAFTALSVFLLEADGRVSRDGLVRQWLPELAVGNDVRVHHLLEHTSGFRDQWQLLGLAGVRTDGDLVSQEDVLSLLFRQRGVCFAPGTDQLYCNSGYTLLAEIVRRASGDALPTYAAREIFDPLGMARTCFRADPYELLDERAESYEPAPGGFRRVPLQFGTYGATGLVTTAEDLLRFAQCAWSEDGAQARELERMQARARLVDGTELDFVNGLSVRRFRGLRCIGHPGADAGFRSAFLAFPDQRVAIALLANTSAVDTWAVPERIAEIYLADRLEPVPVTEVAEPGVQGPEPAPVAAGDLSAYVGRYASAEADAFYDIELVDGALVARQLRNGSIPLKPIGVDRFGCDEWFLRDVEFQRDEEGIVGFLASSSRSRGVRFERLR